MSEEKKEGQQGGVVDETGATDTPPIIPELNRPWRPQDADRFDIKEYTRKRVQNYHVTEGTIFKPAKPKPSRAV